MGYWSENNHSTVKLGEWKLQFPAIIEICATKPNRKCTVLDIRHDLLVSRAGPHPVTFIRQFKVKSIVSIKPCLDRCKRTAKKSGFQKLVIKHPLDLSKCKTDSLEFGTKRSRLMGSRPFNSHVMC